MKKLNIAFFVSIAFLCAACSESHSSAKPLLPQEALAARADPDFSLAEKVERALGVGSSTAYGVEVTAHEGKVELWGTVDSHATRERLEVSAAGVVGVKALLNHLHVDPGP